MMIGLTIFTHSMRQVAGNLGMALKASGWFMGIYALGLGLIMWQAPDFVAAALSQNSAAIVTAMQGMGGNAGLVAVVFFAAVVFLLWAVSLVAIVWHRYILLEEVPQGFVPYRKDFHVGRYFWVGFGISMLAVLAVSVISGILGMIFGPVFYGAAAGNGAMAALGALFPLVIGIIIIVLYLRMALVLPAVALDKRLTLGRAWQQTSGQTRAIFVLALVLAAVNMIVPLVIHLAFGSLFWINLGLSSLFQWFYFMLNISVLSTLYGYIVEKREVY